MIIMGGLVHTLTGCAAQAMGMLRSGENASYSVNNIAPRELEQVRLVDGMNPDRWYFSQSGQAANTWKPSAKYPKSMPSFGGNQYSSDSGHKIPDELLVSWREMPAPGSQPYTGEAKGPFRIKVRSRIPEDVLRQIRREGVSLQLSFTAGELPILFNWKLVDYHRESALIGIEVLRQGGDSY
jgi:hypothetical protein